MAWFVKTICGFPGALIGQFGILFATTLAMSTICLAISAGTLHRRSEPSLLAIYLVGFPTATFRGRVRSPPPSSTICRPFIAAYWGWSGYLTSPATPEPMRPDDPRLPAILNNALVAPLAPTLSKELFGTKASPTSASRPIWLGKRPCDAYQRSRMRITINYFSVLKLTKNSLLDM